jgi:hypothetical protein
MAYQPMNTYNMNSPQAIYLYTTPLNHDFINGSFKKPINLFAHWAICIDNTCYELRAGDKKKGEKEKFLYKSVPVEVWIRNRNYTGQPKPVGHLSGQYSSRVIDLVGKCNSP